MRLLALVLGLAGCAADAEPPLPIVWEPEQVKQVNRAADWWYPYTASGHQIYCDQLDPIRIQCAVAGETWVVGRAYDLIDGWATGQARYAERRVWLWSGTNGVELAARHEFGHALMPVAGNSETQGHTATGVMRPDADSGQMTDEVRGLCRAEGACR